jgi:flagellar protein FliO/FliZ
LKERGLNSIEILETRPVGGRKTLCLVKVRGENLLLGLGTDRIDLLLHFDSSKTEQRFDNELQERFEGRR